MLIFRVDKSLKGQPNEEQTRRFLLLKKQYVSWIRAVVEQYNGKIGEVCFRFCNDECILAINQKYLNHDYYTDVITFDYSESDFIHGKAENNPLWGDIFISIDTVLSNSEQYHTHAHTEFLRVMIHGILHLLGQDDQTEEDRAEMTRKEEAALQLFKY